MEKEKIMNPLPGILVVDDQPANLRAMQRLLQGIPATVTLAKGGEPALALCMQHQFALALIDVHMPDMSGFELADYLRGAERTRNIPLIFITAALTDERHTLRGYQTGAVDYIQKPIDDRILRSKVEVFLELHNAREELRRHRDHLSQRVAERTASLEQAQTKLHALNRHLIRVREEERRHIAQAMHDEMGNTLAQQKMTIEWLQLNHFDHDRLWQELERLKHQVEDAIAKVRHLTLMMRPPILDQCGLAAALEWQAAEFEKTSGIPCLVETGMGETILDEDGKIALFRILQESLTNVSRHARATEVRIDLTRDSDCVRLVIEDNGRGIADDILTDPLGNLGLRGMEERACQNGGELHIESSRQGTRITANMPISHTMVTEKTP
ncbi:MAG: response regulator [Magnetococcales bacterium]|nr:response regulator [Magnetococcales bacterium]MBF0148526.1 response regulator [Magnetococcales bacterium]MBF0172647.1 response regulator [Magnetococcales bacterium]MBF0346507.1 response regulator [Magnetococcales bacterium]MBF0629782.1 response regulator [Magnetococcales bacterium]